MARLGEIVMGNYSKWAAVMLVVLSFGCGDDDDVGTASAGSSSESTGGDSSSPVSCELPDDTDSCRFAASLVRCDLPDEATTVCLGECTDAGATNCRDDCRPDEYAASCGGIGPSAPAADPPPGCGDARFTPAGVALYCCRCRR
jgi:hypothetical protein